MSTIRHEVWVKADAARVFDAFTTVDGLNAWWGPALHAEPQVGSVIEFDHGLGAPFLMKVTDLLPEQRAAWECISEYADKGNPASEWFGHRLEFNLSSAAERPESAWMAGRLFGADSAAGITILDFSHSGWSDDSQWFAFCNSGWGVALGGLKRACESRG